MPMSVSRERGDSTFFLGSPVLGAQEQLWENSVPHYSVTGFFLPVVPGSGGFSSLALLPWLFCFTSLETGYDKVEHREVRSSSWLGFPKADALEGKECKVLHPASQRISRELQDPKEKVTMQVIQTNRSLSETPTPSPGTQLEPPDLNGLR